MNKKEGKPFQERTNYLKAKELSSKGRFKEASQSYLQALKQAYDPQEAAIKIAIYAGLGECFRVLRNFDKSEHYFSQGVRFADSSEVKKTMYTDEEMRKDIIEQKYQILTNYGLLLTDKLEEPRQTTWMWSDFKKIQDTALNKLKEARKIIQTRLRRAQNFGSQSSNKWQIQYMKNLVNIIGLLKSEASQFNCPQIYKLIIEIVSKGEQFARTHSENEDLQKFLHKSYYFKGFSFARLGNLQQAYKYLKNDYDYCTKMQEAADRQVTANYLIQMLGSNQRYDQAFKFSYKEQFKNKVNTFKQYSSQYLQKIEYVKDQSKEFRKRVKEIKCLFEAIEQMGRSRDAFQKIKKSIEEQADIFLNLCQSNLSSKQCYQFLFSATEWLYTNEKFEKAYKYYEKSVKYVKKQTKQQMDGISLKLLIQGNLYSDKQIVTKMYKEAIEKAKKINYAVDTLQINLKDYLQEEQRKEDFWKKTVKQILGIEQQQNFEQGILQDNPNVGRGNKNANDKKKDTVKDLLKIYLQNCKQQNVVPRVPIEKRLPDKTENATFPFDQFYNLPEQQIILVVKLFESFQNLDLRQHRMTEAIAEAINDKIVDADFVGFGKGMRTKLFKTLLNKPNNLKILKIRYYEKFEFFTSQTILSMLQHPSQLRVLSLKECLLKDKDVSYMGIQKLSSLETLSLVDNELNGHFCKCLKDLEKLQKLNLSGNPLSQLSIAPKSLKLLKLQRMKGLPNTPESEQSFFDMLNYINLQKLELSSNYEPLLSQFLSKLCDYCVAKEVHFEHLKEIECTQVQITQKVFWESLRRIVLNNKRLRKLNLNNLTGNQQQLEKFQKFIKDQNLSLSFDCKDFLSLDMLHQQIQPNQEYDL